MSKRTGMALVGLICFLLGVVVSQQAALVQAQDASIKPPKWLHAVELRARKAGESDFNKDTKKYGIEVFRDDNNGNLIYISETGSIAVVPGK